MSEFAIVLAILAFGFLYDYHEERKRTARESPYAAIAYAVCVLLAVGYGLAGTFS